MWRLLVVALIALAPLGLSRLAQDAGVRVTLDPWLRKPERLVAAPQYPPPADWHERSYLAANPDVAAAVRNGDFESGYEHYRIAGLREGRSGGFPAPRTVAEVPQP